MISMNLVIYLNFELKSCQIFFRASRDIKKDYQKKTILRFANKKDYQKKTIPSGTPPLAGSFDLPLKQKI